MGRKASAGPQLSARLGTFRLALAALLAATTGALAQSGSAGSQAPTEPRPRPPATTPAPAAPAAPGPPAAPAPAEDASRAAFDALAEADRKAIQDALVWTGDYAGTVDGTFGRRTFEAILAFERRAKLKPDGVLDEQERRALAAAAAQARRAVRFEVQSEPSGTRIGVPLKFAEQREKTPKGMRYRSRDERVVLETESLSAAEADLPGLFERLKADAPGRKVSYSVLRPDWFVIGGDAGTRRFYTRFESGPSGLKGFTFTYERALGPELDRVAVAVANSFRAFPEIAAAPPARPGDPTSPALPAPAPRPQTTAETSTGIVVGSTRIIAAARAVENCTRLTVAGRPARLIQTDPGQGLATIETATPKETPPVIASPRPPPDEDLVVFGFSALSGPEPVLAAAPGRIVGREDRVLRMAAPVQPTVLGAVAFDRTGALVGMLAARPSARAVAGVIPETEHPLVPAAEVIRVAALERPAVAAPPGRILTAGELASALAGTVVPIACVR